MQVLGEQLRTDEYLFESAVMEKVFTDAAIRESPSAIYANMIFVAVDPCSGGSASKIGVTLLYFPMRANHVTVLARPLVQNIHVVEYVADDIDCVVYIVVPVCHDVGCVGVVGGKIDFEGIHEHDNEPETRCVICGLEYFTVGTGV